MSTGVSKSLTHAVVSPSRHRTLLLASALNLCCFVLSCAPLTHRRALRDIEPLLDPVLKALFHRSFDEPIRFFELRLKQEVKELPIYLEGAGSKLYCRTPLSIEAPRPARPSLQGGRSECFEHV
jgi:hypothetical protein